MKKYAAALFFPRDNRMQGSHSRYLSRMYENAFELSFPNTMMIIYRIDSRTSMLWLGGDGMAVPYSSHHLNTLPMRNKLRSQVVMRA